MNKLITLFFLLLPVFVFGQLDGYAMSIKEKDPELFESIRHISVYMHQNDTNEFISKEINIQCKAYIDLTQIATNTDYYFIAVKKNVLYEDIFNTYIDKGLFNKAFILPINWVETLKIYKKLLNSIH